MPFSRRETSAAAHMSRIVRKKTSITPFLLLVVPWSLGVPESESRESRYSRGEAGEAVHAWNGFIISVGESENSRICRQF